MSIIEKLRINAGKKNKSIIFSDGNDERTIKAAYELISNKLCRPSLIGDREYIMPIYSKLNPESDLDIIDINDKSYTEKLAAHYYEKRKSKGETMESALEAVKRPCYFGAVAVDCSLFDGCVAGSLSSSAEVLRGALRGIGMKKGMSKISSFIILETPLKEYGTDGTFFMADIAINPYTDSITLADIAVSTADSYKLLTEDEARVALLSFSTLGSAEGESVDKVREALKIVKENRPDILIDGEMQFDAALIEEVGKRKAPESKVAGKANVFIFPNLDAGNIGYKITERMCKGATATGPILQGLAKPMNDLSRGCSYIDIVNTALVTIFQSENN